MEHHGKTNRTQNLTLMFHSLEILQPPEDGREKVVDRKRKAKNVDESQTNKTKHQNLVFPMHLVCGLLPQTPLSDLHHNLYQLLVS